MNHLCGLTNLNNDDHGLRNLDDAERKALKAFRVRFDSALCHENTLGDKKEDSNHGSIDDDDDVGNNDDEKEESSHHIQDDDTTKAAAAATTTTGKPTYEFSEDQLSPSGMRPLDDATLYRYLLADRQAEGTFDEEASYQRLLSALQFRKEHKSDVIVQNIAATTTTSSSSSSSAIIPPHILKGKRMRIAIWAGVDNQSRPVVFERLGEFFSSGNAVKMPFDDWLECYLYFLETHFAKMRESAKKTGRPVDRIVYFADFQGVVSSILNRKIWKVAPLLKRLVKTVECHYPEIVDHITLFNVPRVASAAYNAMKGFVDPVTADKIELFSGVPSDRFKEMMSEDVIPVEYGGRNKIEYPQTALE